MVIFTLQVPEAILLALMTSSSTLVLTVCNLSLMAFVYPFSLHSLIRFIGMVSLNATGGDDAWG